MEKIGRQVFLYDFYGELLTDHQKSVYEDVVLNDMSLSEIADERGISRQGVHDTLARAEALLENFEQKTGCVARDVRVRQALADICDAAEQLLQLPDAAALAGTILAAAGRIKE